MWNADGSKVLIQLATGSNGSEPGGPALVNGSTFAYEKRWNVSYDNRWHPTNPNWLVVQNGNSIQALDHNTGAVASTLFTFSNSLSGTQLFGDEGSPSRDGRYWLGCPVASSGRDLVCVDTIDKVVTGTIRIPSGIEIQTQLNWWSMSRKGTFIVTQSQVGWTTRDGVGVPAGLNVWDRAGKLLRTMTASGWAWHMDMGTDVAGNEVAVILGDNGYNANGAKVRAIKSWRLDGANGNTPRMEAPSGMIREAWHIACPTISDGWAVVSSFGASSEANYGKEGTLYNTVFAVRIDGSQKVGIIANVRHPENDSADMGYYNETHACVHPTMQAVAWTSVWSYASSSAKRASHLYVARGE
jgi:hypothetical protein